GNMDVLVRYGSQMADIAVTVPKFMRGDLNGDGQVDQADMNILLDALNTPANRPVDARDLDGDGRIDISDARILATLCAKLCTFDTTPPVITPSIAGTTGANGWYVSNVTVAWSVTDPESGITFSSGCGPTTLTADTAGITLVCTATNGVGLSASVSGSAD